MTVVAALLPDTIIKTCENIIQRYRVNKLERRNDRTNNLNPNYAYSSNTSTYANANGVNSTSKIINNKISNLSYDNKSYQNDEHDNGVTNIDASRQDYSSKNSSSKNKSQSFEFNVSFFIFRCFWK